MATPHTSYQGRLKIAPLRRHLIAGHISHAGLFDPPADILPSVATWPSPMSANSIEHVPSTVAKILHDLTTGTARSDNQHAAGRQIRRPSVPVRCDLECTGRKRSAARRN